MCWRDGGTSNLRPFSHLGTSGSFDVSTARGQTYHRLSSRPPLTVSSVWCSSVHPPPPTSIRPALAISTPSRIHVESARACSHVETDYPLANSSSTSRWSLCGSGTQATDDCRHTRPSEHMRRLANVRTTNDRPQSHQCDAFWIHVQLVCAWSSVDPPPSPSPIQVRHLGSGRDWIPRSRPTVLDIPASPLVHERLWRPLLEALRLRTLDVHLLGGPQSAETRRRLSLPTGHVRPDSSFSRKNLSPVRAHNSMREPLHRPPLRCACIPLREAIFLTKANTFRPHYLNYTFGRHHPS